MSNRPADELKWAGGEIFQFVQEDSIGPYPMRKAILFRIHARHTRLSSNGMKVYDELPKQDIFGTDIHRFLQSSPERFRQDM